MKTLSVIVPVYCNGETLPLLDAEFNKIEAELAALDMALELIFVDDGSYDDSLARLMDIRARRDNAKVVKLTRNFGAVGAVKTGFRFCSGDCFVAVAADLQDPVDRLPEMVQHWLDGARYVILVRRERGDPLATRLFAGLFQRLVRRLIFANFPKGGFDVALMDKALLPHMQNSGKNVNPSLMSFYLGYKPTILHYDREERRHGTSKWNFRRKLNYFVDSLLGFSNKPMRIAAMLGLSVAAVSFLYGLMVIVATLIEGSPVPGFPSLAALISFLCGTILFVLATIGEYVWRIFDQLDQRPEAVVEEVF
jgi:glycosyltransferase involved in cell wall biosynthesis